MKVKIVLLVKEHFAEYCKNTFSCESEDMVISFKTYETLEEMTEIYGKLVGQCDAVITSGPLPYTLLHRYVKPGHPILACFLYDLENIYHIILKESMYRNYFDLSRIGIEVLPPGVSFQQTIEENSFPHYAKLFEQRFLTADIDTLKKEEEAVSSRYKKLVSEGKLDYIITYFYSVVVAMKDMDINCYYVYPSEKEFFRVLDLVYSQVSLRRAEKRIPAVIYLPLRAIQSGTVGMELRISELQTALLEFIKLHQYDISVKQGGQYFQLYTDAETLEQMTEEYQICPLPQSIPLVRQLCSAVGCGVGHSLFHATQNAIKAAQYALELDSANKASYFIDSNGSITALPYDRLPKQTWFTRLPKDRLVSLAEQASLSLDTITKILSVLHAMGTFQVTSQDLIERLGISLRTANRYLANLTKAGLAQTVGQISTVKKGRPVNIYSLETLGRDLLPDLSDPQI